MLTDKRTRRNTSLSLSYPGVFGYIITAHVCITRRLPARWRRRRRRRREMRARIRNRYRSQIKMILRSPAIMIPASQIESVAANARARAHASRPRRSAARGRSTATPARYRMQIANTIKRYCVFYFSRNYILSNFITRRYRLAAAHTDVSWHARTRVNAYYARPAD